ncbi:MAG: hypothetical protein Q8O03_05735 [Nanoarchaeota archaeon]|nr:hypothetical protein [Nanoarchaeota archaeon]
MKRRLLVVLTIFVSLISIYSVYAQEAAEEDKVLGMSVSSLLVTIPIGMIVLGLLFFVGLYLKDHYRNIAYFLKGKFRRRKLREVTKKVADYPQDLQDLQKRLPVLEPEDALQRLSSLVKKFFSEKINMDYEFTHRELEKELEKINPNWASLPKRIDYVKYSGESLSKKDVEDLIKEFWNIVKYEKRKRISLTITEKLKKRSLILEIGVLKNLKHYLAKIKPSEEEKLTSKDVVKYFAKRQKQRIQSTSDFLKKIKTDFVNSVKAQLESVNKIVEFFSNKLTEKRIDNMLDLLEGIRKQISKGRIDQARIKYKQAYQLYYKIPVEEQAHIITELQNLQQKIHEYKPQLKIKETPIDKIKEFIKKYVQTKISQQTTNKANNLIKEAQKQINQNKIEQARNTHQQAYQLYYQLPIEEQSNMLFQLKKIKDQIRDVEKNKEMIEVEELAKELKHLKSEEDVYIIFDKGGISKKLGYLSNYIRKVSEQEIHGLKAGKDHLKEKLKDLAKTAEKIEKEEAKDLTHKEKKFLNRIKDIGTFFNKQEAALEKTFQHTQKQVFDQIHNITQKIKTKPPEKEPIKVKKPVKAEPAPSKPPMPSPIHAVKELAYAEKTLTYLKNKEEQGMYKIKPSGKEFLNKIESVTKSIKESEQKGITELKPHEKGFLESITSFLRKDKEKHVPPIEEEKRMLGFLEHMKEKEMIHLDEQKLQKEKERLAKPIIELPKVRMDIERLKKLQADEEKIMKELQKIPKTQPMLIHHVREKPLRKYEWEVTADDIRRKKTRVMNDLLKEEEDIQSKLRNLE